MTVNLAGRVVVVTGGGRGLGRAHSLELARQGATVVVADPGASVQGDPTTENPADLVVKEIQEAGGQAVARDVSVTDYDGTAELIAATVREFGRLDAVVNNAGITRDRTIVNMTERDWDDVIAVHLKGTFNLTHHAAVHWRGLSKSGAVVNARIINTVSGTGLLGNPGQSSYGAAKAAIANFTLISAMELERYGVTVNAIAPLARTRMTEGVGISAGEGTDRFDPLDPSNSSPVVAYLASVPSGWLNGQVIRVDGNRLRFYHRWQVSERSYVPAPDRAIDYADVDLGLRALYGAVPLGIADGRLT